MVILEFPKHDVSKGYISRLDAQNEQVQKAMANASQASQEMMFQMQTYLGILQNFIKDADPEVLTQFLRDKGEEHSLDLTVDYNVSFQYQFDFGLKL